MKLKFRQIAALIFSCFLIFVMGLLNFATVEREEPAEEYPFIKEGQKAEFKRIESLGLSTFTPDGKWIWADPNHDAHYKEQMKILGWDRDK